MPGARFTPTRLEDLVGDVAITTPSNGQVLGYSSGQWVNLSVSSPSPANPSANVGLTAVNGSASTFMRSDGAPAISQGIAPIWTGLHVFAPSARSSGSSPYLKVTAPADTTLTAATECVGLILNLSATRQFATGNIATQRECMIQAPTYSAVGASTITTAATLDITGPPIAGGNVTITNPYALYVESGTSYFGGNINADFGFTLSVTSGGTLSVPSGNVIALQAYAGGNPGIIAGSNQGSPARNAGNTGSVGMIGGNWHATYSANLTICGGGCYAGGQTGGHLYLQGGDYGITGSGNVNGGNIYLTGGLNLNGGTPGTVNIGYDGTSAYSKIGIYGATPVSQPSAITVPSGGSTVDTQARTAITSILNAIGAAAGGIGITA